MNQEIFSALLSGNINPYIFNSGEEMIHLLIKAGLMLKSQYDCYLAKCPINMKVNNTTELELKQGTEFNFGWADGAECIYFLDERCDTVYDIIYDLYEIRINMLNLDSKPATSVILGRVERRYQY